MFYKVREKWWSLLAFLHRGRHGFAKRDAWNIDMYMARVKADILTEYIRQLETSSVFVYPSECDDLYNDPKEGWLVICRTMRDGFKAYAEWKEDDGFLPIDESDMTSAEWIAAYKAKERAIHDGLEQAMYLWGYWFRHMWW